MKTTNGIRFKDPQQKFGFSTRRVRGFVSFFEKSYVVTEKCLSQRKIPWKTPMMKFD